MNVLLPGKVGDSSSRSSTKGPTNKCALSATRNRADERTAARATCDPCPIAFFVIAALPLGVGSRDGISLPVKFDGLKCQLETRTSA
jgi:hypothetical protein